MGKKARRRRSGLGYTTLNKIRLVHGGRPYFDELLGMIGQAREVIHLQVYIFDDDETGREIAHALIEAAKRGVRVYLLADGYASQHLPGAFIRNLEESGIHFRFFEPLFKSRNSYFGRRMHHKVFVADSRFAMAGGINISNHYNDLPDQRAWLDFALHMEGEIASELCRICQKIWQGYLTGERLNLCHEFQFSTDIKPSEKCQVRVRRNDWVMKRNQVSRSYIEMFRRASDSITMMSGYFIPGPIIRKYMRKAAARGVKIRLILAGMSDVRISKNAERFMYDWLLRNNIEVYEYKPCVLHGKVAVYDRQWATIGSYNLNIISAYASLELNIDINNAPFAETLDDELEKIIREESILISEENFKMHRGFLNKLMERVSYSLVRLLFYLFTFNFKQRDN